MLLKKLRKCLEEFEIGSSGIGMGGFILTALSVALLSGVIGLLTPEGNTKKYVRLVGALCILGALASPIVAFITEGEDGLDLLFPSVGEESGDYGEIYESAIADGMSENAEDVVKNMLVSRFDLSEENIEVSLSVERQGGKYTVTSATVTLKSSLIFADPREISEYINGELDCPCTVVYG